MNLQITLLNFLRSEIILTMKMIHPLLSLVVVIEKDLNR